MNEKILRYHYRGHLNADKMENLKDKIEETKIQIAKFINADKIMTACVYRHENMLFAYYEPIGDEINPELLFAPLSDSLAKWPGQTKDREWVVMNHIFFHAIPEGKDDWKRKVKPELQRGRIAFLKPDKMFDYVYHHVAITTEGYLLGDKYQSIALHENILFSYFEEPKTEINIKRDLTKESEVIKDWQNVKPEDHFIKGPENTNFTFIPAIITMGQ